jgi:hypothetical protein
MTEYQPGRCNIGRRQRRRRLAVAGVAFGLAALVAAGYVAGALPIPALGAVFVLLALGFEWGIQAYAAFCVRLAVLSRYDFRGDGGEAGTVTDPRARYDDRVQAAKITAAAVALAGATTGLLAVAPL